MKRYSPQIHGRWCRKKGHNWQGKEPFEYEGITFHRDLCLRCRHQEDDRPMSLLVTCEFRRKRSAMLKAMNAPNPLWERLQKGAA